MSNANHCNIQVSNIFFIFISFCKEYSNLKLIIKVLFKVNVSLYEKYFFSKYLILFFKYLFDNYDYELKYSFAIQDAILSNKTIHYFIKQGDYNFQTIRDFHTAIKWYEKALAIKKSSGGMQEYIEKLKPIIQKEEEQVIELYDSLERYKQYVLNVDPTIKKEFYNNMSLFDSLISNDTSLFL